MKTTPAILASAIAGIAFLSAQAGSSTSLGSYTGPARKIEVVNLGTEASQVRQPVRLDVELTSANSAFEGFVTYDVPQGKRLVLDGWSGATHGTDRWYLSRAPYDAGSYQSTWRAEHFTGGAHTEHAYAAPLVFKSGESLYFTHESTGTSQITVSLTGYLVDA